MPVTDDYNGEQQEGFGRGQYTIRDGYRSSAATAYLKPARKRGKSRRSRPARMPPACCCRARARPASNTSKASGDTVRVEADREVILAAGAFNTPPLLMLSGIGPAAHLAEMRHQAGGRSAGRQEPAGPPGGDHLFSAPRRAARSATTCASTAWRSAMIRAYCFGTGPGTVVPGGLHAFVKTRPELAVPDIEFMFRGAPADTHLWFPLIRPAYADGYGIRPTLLHPDSRGEILLRSTDPRDAAAHRLQFLLRAERSSPPARRLQARPRRGLPEADGALPRQPRPRPARASRPTPRSTPSSGGPRSRRTIPAGPAPSDRARRRARSGAAGARRRAAARGRCLGHARPRLGAYQRLRSDDGGEGLRHDSRPAAAAGRSASLRRDSRPELLRSIYTSRRAATASNRADYYALH